MAAITGVTGLAARAALEYLTGKALRWTTTRTAYLMMLTQAPPSDDPTIAQLTEVIAAGYARQPVSLGSATTNATTNLSVISNAAQVVYGPFTAASGIGANPATWAALVTALTGTAGDVVCHWLLDNQGVAAQNESLVFPAGNLNLTLT